MNSLDQLKRDLEELELTITSLTWQKYITIEAIKQMELEPELTEERCNEILRGYRQ